jgi:hypothetical protein
MALSGVVVSLTGNFDRHLFGTKVKQSHPFYAALFLEIPAARSKLTFFFFGMCRLGKQEVGWIIWFTRTYILLYATGRP